eukprot:753500_1
MSNVIDLVSDNDNAVIDLLSDSDNDLDIGKPVSLIRSHRIDRTDSNPKPQKRLKLHKSTTVPCPRSFMSNRTPSSQSTAQPIALDIENGNNEIHNVFRMEIVRHVKQKKFARTRTTCEVSGRYTVSGTYTRVSTNKYHVKAEMDHFILGTSDPLTVEISLEMDHFILGTSDPLTVPSSEKTTYRDNGVFCCCGAINDDKSEYNQKDTTKHHQIKNKYKTKLLKGTKITIIDLPRIEKGNIHCMFSINKNDIHRFAVDKDTCTNQDDTATRWIICDGQCRTWQHVKCLNWTNDEYKDHIDNKLYFCPLLCSDDHENGARYSTTIRNISKLSSYKRAKKTGDDVQHKRYQDIFMKSLSIEGKMEALSQYSRDELVQLSYNIGTKMDCDASTDAMIRHILSTRIFEQTPPKLAMQVAQTEIRDLNTHDAIRICELGCGNGMITVQIAEQYPNATIHAFEINPERIYAAKKKYSKRFPNIKWIVMDVLSDEFICEYMVKQNYDIVFSNPPFEYGYEFIFIGITIGEWLVYLLPCGYFEGTAARIRLARILSFDVKKRYAVGVWNYYQQYDRHGNVCNKGGRKITPDSIWLMKRCPRQIGHPFHTQKEQNTWRFEDRFVYKTYHPLLMNNL